MKKYCAEFVGTFVLTLLGCGAVAVSGGVNGVLGILGIAFAFGLSIVAMAYSIGQISGCHINPAVSLGMLLSNRMSRKDFAGYIVAQVAGAICAAGVLYFIESQSSSLAVAVNGLGTNGYGSQSYVGLKMGGAFVVEVILTAIFVLVVLGVTEKESFSNIAGVVIGLTLTFVNIIGIPLTGTSVNPARSFGPALLSGGTALHQVWLFIVAPLVGAVVAAVIWKYIKEVKAE